jgi:hypothetical protein
MPCLLTDTHKGMPCWRESLVLCADSGFQGDVQPVVVLAAK